MTRTLRMNVSHPSLFYFLVIYPAALVLRASGDQPLPPRSLLVGVDVGALLGLAHSLLIDARTKGVAYSPPDMWSLYQARAQFAWCNQHLQSAYDIYEDARIQVFARHTEEVRHLIEAASGEIYACAAQLMEQRSDTAAHAVKWFELVSHSVAAASRRAE
jgi:uncharacterized membrane protein (UPF0136 family)